MTTDPDTELIEYLAEHDAQCPKCEYQLRSLTEPVCPECGIKLTLASLFNPFADDEQADDLPTQAPRWARYGYVFCIGVPLTLVFIVLVGRTTDSTTGPYFLGIPLVIATGLSGPIASGLVLLTLVRNSDRDGN